MYGTILVAFVCYIGIVGSAVYFCMFADPETSVVAEFLTETAPQKLWSFCDRVFGKKYMKVLEWIVDRFMILIYVVVVFGSWSIVFYYVYPWVDTQTYVSQWHKYVGYILFASCVISWRAASTTSPGIITQNTLAIYNHFPFDELMFASKKRCPTRKIPRLARSKFDRYKYNENVPRFDHFCGWVFNTIGEENYRWFLLFLAVHVAMCLYGASILSFLFYGHLVERDLHRVPLINRATGEDIAPGNWWILSQYLFHRFFLEAGVLLLMAVMGLCLGGFLLYHVWITSRGLTTNECYKWDEIKKWYKDEVKRYKQAVKDGRAISEPKMAQPPKVSDGDVTCTPGMSSQPKEEEPATEEDDDEDLVADPGPPPKNIYDRGFVENWKEVIFPISLRKRYGAASASKEKKAT